MNVPNHIAIILDGMAAGQRQRDCLVAMDMLRAAPIWSRSAMILKIWA